MSLLVDPRAGSQDLIRPLAAMGLPVEAEMLAFGDLAFVGKDRRVVGIEFKTLRECVESLRSGRLVGHQLPGMLGKDGHYEVAWLLIEGEWKPGDDGALTVPRWHRGRPYWDPLPGKMSVDEFLKRLNTLIEKHGLLVWPSQSRPQTLAWIAAQYRWWTDATPEAHDSGTALYHRPMGIGFTAIADDQRAVAAWPGVGVKWSQAALKAFGSVEAAAAASASSWAALEHAGKRFGDSRAAKVRCFLQGKG